MASVTNARERRKMRPESLERLRSLCPPGTAVYTIVKHVARSGMSRRIELYVISDNEPIYISGLVSNVLDLPHDRDGGVTVGGCGMDMGHHLVMNLSYALHGHASVNVPTDREGRPFAPSPDAYRAGYSLIQRWM